MTRGIGDRPQLRLAAAVLATGAAGLAVGALTIAAPGLAVVAAAVAFGAAVAIAGASPLLLLAFPAVFISRRVGPGALDMSVADLTLLLSALVALPLAPWQNVHVRRVAWAMAVYLALLLLTVIAEPSQRAVFEWAHRGAFLLGGLAVGSAVGRHDRVRLAFRLLLLGAIVVSVAAVLQSLGTGFAPAYPLALNKNFAGGLLSMTLIALVAVPSAVGLNRRTMLVVRVVVLLGLVATQSRGAVAGLFFALALWSVLADGRGVRVAVVLPAAALAALALLVSFQAAVDRPGASDFTPENARRISNRAALREWEKEPWFGVGLRYFKRPGYRFDLPSYRNTYIETHSVWYSTLGESGIVGLTALAVLLGLTLRALRHAGGPLALAAGLVVVARLAHGMVDIYWVAGTQTLPWLLVGIAAARGRSEGASATADASSVASGHPALLAT